MMIIYFTIAINFLSLLHFGEPQAYKYKPQPTPYHDWDYLIFSQRWPLTACTEWEEAKSGNTCNLPKPKDSWTIHGIWPTKTGHEGPLYCPSAIHFNPEELTTMLNDLNNFWTNVEANTKPNSFWAHEWNKHGTCASVLPQFDSVTNYFKMGLKLRSQYDLTTILNKGGVTPGNNGYDVALIYSVIKNAINKEPSIQCVIDRKTKESYINEIRICFDKNLNLMDCDPASPIQRMRYGLNTNCNQKKPVRYIDNVPVPNLNSDNYNKEIDIKKYYDQQARFTRLYQLFRTIFWMTI
ncbi:ribonuclease Oy [Anthonomus grandis grandis]|uniref:ribonuclease Oy n=1 Tax=Anthonomus grandis grandis TaxID=2921223 RepID=UPI002165593A|nr:ribonuclease Oy [Anthonomus grandis grandis]